MSLHTLHPVSHDNAKRKGTTKKTKRRDNDVAVLSWADVRLVVSRDDDVIVVVSRDDDVVVSGGGDVIVLISGADNVAVLFQRLLMLLMCQGMMIMLLSLLFQGMGMMMIMMMFQRMMIFFFGG